MKNHIVNKKGKQIHYAPAMTGLCNVDERLPHYYRCRRFRAWLLLTFFGYDGCAWCWPEKHSPHKSTKVR